MGSAKAEVSEKDSTYQDMRCEKTFEQKGKRGEIKKKKKKKKKQKKKENH